METFNTGIQTCIISDTYVKKNHTSHTKQTFKKQITGELINVHN